MTKINARKGFLEFVYDFYTNMMEYDVSIAYEGSINHQIMKAFTTVCWGNMSEKAESELVRKRVYHVMVECLQNIAKHAFAQKNVSEAEKSHGIVMVSNNTRFYQVTTGNLIMLEETEKLKKFIDKINSLDRDSLNRMYKKQLQEGSLSNKGGAGLGFIDIKRKTGENLKYDFLPVDDNNAFFLLTATINRF